MDGYSETAPIFGRSNAFFDREYHLVSWDRGFELEFDAAADFIKAGASYSDIFDTLLANCDQFSLGSRHAESEKINQPQIFRRDLGKARSFVYTSVSGRRIRVEEAVSSRGEIFRTAEDVTQETKARQELATAKQLANVNQNQEVVPQRFTVKPDGVMHLPPPSVALKRLCGLPDDFDAPDPMMLYSRVEMSPDERAANAREALRCMATLEPYVYVYRIRDIDGNLRWIHNCVLPRREPNGEFVFEGGARDITRERLAENQIDLLRAVVVQSLDSVIVVETDPAGKAIILYVNPAFERLFGHTLAELAGKDVKDYSQNPIDVAVDRQLQDRLARGEDDPVEFEAATADGTSKWIEARICMLQREADGRYRWAVISRDVSDRKQAAEELERSRQSLADAQRIARIGNWSIDLATQEVVWSQELYRQLGIDPASDRPSIELTISRTHPDDIPAIRNEIESLLTGRKRIVSCDYRVRPAPGLERIIHGELRLIADEDGKPIRMVGTAQDVTDLRRAQERLERSERMLQDAQRIAQLGSWHTDLTTGEVHWSDGLYRIGGLDPARHSPDHDLFLGLVHPEDRSKITWSTEGAFDEASRRVTGDYRIRRPDGEERFLHTEAEIVKDAGGRPVEIVGTAQDVTVQRVAEKDLRTALDAARIADRAKSEFLANMSHELRTPLNAIIGFSDLLLIETAPDPALAKLNEYLGDIHAAGKKMLELVDGLLSLSEVASGAVDLKETSFDPIGAIRQACEFAEDKAVSAGICLRSDAGSGLPRVWGDPRLIDRVLVSLIANAIKFTASGGWVEVRAFLSSSGDLQIVVADSGIGMTQDEIALVMAPFGQADASLKRRFGGAGLGLTLARKIIELHGGRIGLQSIQGQGTEATIVIPSSRCMEPHAEVPRASDGQGDRFPSSLEPSLPGGDGSAPVRALSVAIVGGEASTSSDFPATLTPAADIQRQLEDDLAMAKRHIREAEARIARQREIVVDYRARGWDSGLSEALLTTFEDALAHHRELLAKLQASRSGAVR